MDDAHGVEELAESFEGEIFALDRDDDRVGSCEGIDRDKTQRGTAVDDDEVVVVLDGVERTLDEILPVLFIDQFHLGTDKVDASGEDSEVGGVGFDEAVVDVGMPEETLVGALFQIVSVDSKTGGGIGLRVGIDKQHLVLHHRQCGTEVNGSGGFAHTALLVGDRDGFTHVQR